MQQAIHQVGRYFRKGLKLLRFHHLRHMFQLVGQPQSRLAQQSIYIFERQIIDQQN